MALPIRPTPVLEGVDAIRLEKYMAASETHKEPLRNIIFDENLLAAVRAKMDARKFKTCIVPIQ